MILLVGMLQKNLVELGADVYGLIRTKKYNSFLFFENTNKKISLIHGELCDLNLLSRIISEEHINIIFHFAAQVEVGIGLKNPFITFDTIFIYINTFFRHIYIYNIIFTKYSVNF